MEDIIILPETHLHDHNMEKEQNNVKLPKVKKPNNQMKRIYGNALSMNLIYNKQNMEIRGDKCNITIMKNEGKLKIIGDRCRLKIDYNLADVEVYGDGGIVLLGMKSLKDKVRYMGDGGKIENISDSSKKSRKSTEKLVKQPNIAEVGESSTSNNGVTKCEENKTKNVFNKQNKANQVQEKKKEKPKGARIIGNQVFKKNTKYYPPIPDFLIENFFGFNSQEFQKLMKNKMMH